MSQMELIELDPAKAFMLPYAPAVKVAPGSEYVFLSGAVQPSDGVHYPDDIREQTRIVMQRHTETLEANGLTWDDVVHVYDFLTDLRDFVDVFSVMDEFTAVNGWRSANTMIGVNALSRPGARVEIDVIAVRPVASATPVAAARGAREVRLPETVDEQFPVAVSARADDAFLWLSGATAIPLYHHHPHVIEECILPDDPREQARRVLTTIGDVLEFNGLGWKDVVKMSQFLTDLRDYDVIQETVAEFFAGTGWSPASAVVGINGLSGPGARLEIDVVAVQPAQ